MYTVDSTYQQFYVADAKLEPMAPEEWNEDHVRQRYNAIENIVALCPQGDISARVICVPPFEIYQGDVAPDFVVQTSVTIESGHVGVYGWPWELLERYEIPPGTVGVRFSGYQLEHVDIEADYYVVEFFDDAALTDASNAN